MLELKSAHPASKFRTAPRKTVLAQVARPLVAFHDLLAGAPLSERDRFNIKVNDARIRKYQGPWELYRNSRTRDR